MKWIVSKILLFYIIMLLGITGCGFLEDDEAIHIAVVGPMTGEKANGKDMVNGISLYVRQINKEGGIKGKKIVLDIFDDRNNPNEAQKQAEEIINQKKAIGVIGHIMSTCSAKGGEIYKKQGIPAITPVSSEVNLTRENDWYFRIRHNDMQQGEFLAYYVKEALEQKKASIIYEKDNNFSLNVAQSFEKACNEIGVEVSHKWDFSSKSENSEQTFQNIANELKSDTEGAGAVFLSLYSPETFLIIKTIKDVGVSNPLLALDVLYKTEFREKFNVFPKEKENPGYYTNGIYVPSPLIFDTAGSKFHVFRDEYQSKFKISPSVISQFSYDATIVLLNAVKNSDISGKRDDLKKDRLKIRDYLASQTTMKDAVEGVTGLNYFNKYGDSLRPLSMGIFRNQEIVSAFMQLHAASKLTEPANIEKAIDRDQIVQFGDMLVYKTRVVYTGIDIRKISDINTENNSAMFDFFIWFRYQGDIDADNIEFSNAVTPVSLKPSQKEWTDENQEETDKEAIKAVLVKEEKNKENGLMYRLYHIRARFGFLAQYPFYNTYTIGFTFFHREMDRNNLIYVIDILGMGGKDPKSLLENIVHHNVIEKESEWEPEDISLFQDINKKETMGSLTYLNFQNRNIEYSRFNYNLYIKEHTFSLRRKVASFAGNCIMMIFSFAVLILARTSIRHLLSPKHIWLFHALSAFLFMLSAEVILFNMIKQATGRQYLSLIILIFDILWWLVPAFLVHLALQPFVWDMMKKQSGRSVPNVIKRLPAYFIYFIAGYGIVVFVFDQDITKLMATSGVLAMGIGFIVKDNLSNYFASISIIQGYNLKIGNWVKIGDFEDGQIEEITRLTTLLHTRDGSTLSIPNSTVLGSTIYNYNYPDDTYRIRFRLETVGDCSPQNVMNVLETALLAIEGVLKDPGPVIIFQGQGDSSAIYEVVFTVRDYGKKPEYITAAWKSIWIHLEKAGIELATPHRVIHLLDETPKEMRSEK